MMKFGKGLMVGLLLVTTMNAFGYVRTHDNATQTDPSKALTGDIIKVSAKDVAFYCDFEDQIVPVDAEDLGQTNTHHDTLYLCTYVGSKRRVIS